MITYPKIFCFYLSHKIYYSYNISFGLSLTLVQDRIIHTVKLSCLQ